MPANRLIARLDIKGDRLIKGMHLEGWRFLPNKPAEYCFKYYQDGADEILLIDAVASLYGREKLTKIIRETSEGVFIPITAGGGVRNVNDAHELLRSGADKIAVCSEAIKRPEVINEIADRFGRQCMVLSVQAKRDRSGSWDVFYDIGREKTDLNIVDWIKEAVERGAGEILLTSIDFEGTGKGPDIELLSKIRSEVNVPVLLSGGVKTIEHIESGLHAGADGMVMAKSLHFEQIDLVEVRNSLVSNNFNIRQHE